MISLSQKSGLRPLWDRGDKCIPKERRQLWHRPDCDILDLTPSGLSFFLSFFLFFLERNLQHMETVRPHDMDKLDSGFQSGSATRRLQQEMREKDMQYCFHSSGVSPLEGCSFLFSYEGKDSSPLLIPRQGDSLFPPISCPLLCKWFLYWTFFQVSALSVSY